VLGLHEIVVADHELGIDSLADRHLVHAREMRARLDVVVEIGAQIVVGKVAAAGQVRARPAVLVAEQGEATIREDGPDSGEELVPMIGVDRRLIDVADEIRHQSLVERSHCPER
jgi:hypothetical protein